MNGRIFFSRNKSVVTKVAAPLIWSPTHSALEVYLSTCLGIGISAKELRLDRLAMSEESQTRLDQKPRRHKLLVAWLASRENLGEIFFFFSNKFY